jgi:hypothetical protein
VLVVVVATARLHVQETGVKPETILIETQIGVKLIKELKDLGMKPRPLLVPRTTGL